LTTLLIVSYNFPPIQTPESIMALNSVKFLSRLGYNITVLSVKSTAKGLKDHSLLSEVPEGVAVHRVNSLRSIVLRLLHGFSILPDDKVGWIPFALSKGRQLIKQGKIDVLISRSQPPSSHLAALRLKSLTGLPWIANFSDPWAQSPYVRYPNSLVKRFNEYLERKVILRADRLTFTTGQTKLLMVNKYKTLDPDKIMVVPNSYDPSGFTGEKITNDKFTITYAGSFYNIRSPEPLFKALQLLNSEENITGKIEVKLIGSIGSFRHLISEYGLENIVRVIDTIPREDALARLYGSDVLLSVDAPSQQPSVFLPSKLVEYLPMGKPILAITPEGASADLVRLTKTGIVVSPDNVEEIKDTIKKYYNSYLDSTLEITPDWDEIRKYSAEKGAKLLDEAIKGLTG